MSVFTDCMIEFPKKPPVQPPKPEFQNGMKREQQDKFSLWGSHDPAIYRDPVSGYYCIATRPDWTMNAIEGGYIRYNPDTGYYYLFVSYGSLKNDYNIRVGRSKMSVMSLPSHLPVWISLALECGERRYR